VQAVLQPHWEPTLLQGHNSPRPPGQGGRAALRHARSRRVTHLRSARRALRPCPLAGDKPKGLLRLDATLEGREFLVGDSFSVADVAIAAYLLYVPQFFAKVDMGIYPKYAPPRFLVPPSAHMCSQRNAQG
jgi:glutathione S-transferase